MGREVVEVWEILRAREKKNFVFSKQLKLEGQDSEEKKCTEK